MTQLYDQIGAGYNNSRAADPRISARLIELLNLPVGAAVLDVGAGTGNYSVELAEHGYRVTAVEPSATMRGQARSHSSLQWHAGVAEQIPFPDNSFDGAVMTLCLHHMTDWQQGIREALRSTGTGPLVIFAFDVDFPTDFWLFDYFPAFLTLDRNWCASISEIEKFTSEQLRAEFSSSPFPLPKDLRDHFAASGWARPEMYFQESFRSGISSFSKLNESDIIKGLTRLRQDLDSGIWQQKFGHLLALESYDRGYLFMKIQRTE